MLSHHRPCRYTETARDPGQTPQQLFGRLKATTQKGANRMLRIEGILRVIAQDSLSPGRVQSAEDSVAKLRAQLVELQQSEAALEGQVRKPSSVCACHSAASKLLVTRVLRIAAFLSPGHKGRLKRRPSPYCCDQHVIVNDHATLWCHTFFYCVLRLERP